MNGYLLDTNIPPEPIRSRTDPRVVAWVYSQSGETLFLSEANDLFYSQLPAENGTGYA